MKRAYIICLLWMLTLIQVAASETCGNHQYRSATLGLAYMIELSQVNSTNESIWICDYVRRKALFWIYHSCSLLNSYVIVNIYIVTSKAGLPKPGIPRPLVVESNLKPLQRQLL